MKQSQLMPELGALGLGLLAGLLQLIVEAAAGLLILALAALVVAIRAVGRWVFTSPTHARAWWRFWRMHRRQAVPGGWWRFWWTRRRNFPLLAIGPAAG